MKNWKSIVAALTAITFVFMGGISNNTALAGVAQSVPASSKQKPSSAGTKKLNKKDNIVQANAVASLGKKVPTDDDIATEKRTDDSSKTDESKQSDIHKLVTRYAREYGVPTDLAHAVVKIESNYFVKARGRAGEVGLMQIKPATARGMGYRGTVAGLYHPETNVKFGMQYLAKAHQLGGGTTCGAILKYNAGHAAKRMNPTSSKYCAKVKSILGK